MPNISALDNMKKIILSGFWVHAALSLPEEKNVEVMQTSRFFLKGPVRIHHVQHCSDNYSKYFRLCRPYGFRCNCQKNNCRQVNMTYSNRTLWKLTQDFQVIFICSYIFSVYFPQDFQNFKSFFVHRHDVCLYVYRHML